MKTTQFFLNIGINPGYFHDNEIENGQKLVSLLWQQKIERFNIKIGALVSSVNTVYDTHHGCPIGGEETVFLTGLRNPYFCLDDVEWRKTVQTMVEELVKDLNQTTAYLSFTEVDFIYIRSQK